MKWERPTMLKPLFLLAAFACVAPAVHAQTCGGDGGYTCPARENPTQVRDGYDPSAVDWGALVADILEIGGREPRFCNMAIRSWFHDIAGFADEVDTDPDYLPFDGAADGSFITDFNETDQNAGALHGFGQFARDVILQVAAAHGASHADTLTVAAAKCTSGVLAGQVDIAEHCEATGFPLYVGKMDWVPKEGYADYMYRHKARNPPPTHPENGNMATLVHFFIKEMNGFYDEAAWHIDGQDIMAVMGAHGILMTQACTTNGESASGATADMGDRTCGGQGGRQRMFTWDNSFYQDVTASRCFQTNELIEDGDFSRKMTTAQNQAFTQCGFTSMEGFELAEHLECSAMETASAKILNELGQDALDGVEKFGAFNEGWQHAVWGRYAEGSNLPMSAAAPCCGLQCETCEENPDTKFWCTDPITDTARMWPYTYMDCDFNKLFNFGAEGYCSGTRINSLGVEDGCPTCKDECETRWRDSLGLPIDEFVGYLGEMETALVTFREDSTAWEEAYATAFCKLSNFGATYVSGKVSFESVFSGLSEPCLEVNSVLSLKECDTCALEHFNAGVFDGTPLTPASTSPVAEEPSTEEPLNTMTKTPSPPSSQAPSGTGSSSGQQSVEDDTTDNQGGDSSGMLSAWLQARDSSS